VLYDTTGYVSHIRFSPDGSRIAFADHPIWSDDIGSVAVVDREGHKVTLGERWDSLRGVAWAPGGDEIWFTAARGGDGSSLRAVDLRGRQRTVLGGPMGLVLFDISRSGRLLLGRETHLRRVEGLAAGNSRPRDFSLPRDNSVGRQLAPDGNVLVLSDQSVPRYATYIRRADGSPPVRLGEGDAYALSPDGKWLLALTTDAPSRVLLHPTGPGQSREVRVAAGLQVDLAGWLPSRPEIVAFATAPGHLPGAYVLDPGGGPPRLFTQGRSGDHTTSPSSRRTAGGSSPATRAAATTSTRSRAEPPSRSRAWRTATIRSNGRRMGRRSSSSGSGRSPARPAAGPRDRPRDALDRSRPRRDGRPAPEPALHHTERALLGPQLLAPAHRPLLRGGAAHSGD